MLVQSAPVHIYPQVALQRLVTDRPTAALLVLEFSVCHDPVAVCEISPYHVIVTPTCHVNKRQFIQYVLKLSLNQPAGKAGTAACLCLAKKKNVQNISCMQAEM